MNSPYKYRLGKLKGQDVTVDRDSAAAVAGKVSEVGEDGCVIHVRIARTALVSAVFIAYEDIRGIGHEVPDYDNL